MQRLFALFILLSSCLSLHAEKQPNILFLFTDDQRATTLDEKINTPYTDKLRANGVSFENCYLYGANSGAVCKPSRAQLMTGRTHFQLPEIVTAAWAPLEEKDKNPLLHPTFPEHLRKAGYTNFATGKQHNGRKWVETGFDQGSALFMGGMGSHFNLTNLQEYSPEKGWSKKPSKNVFSSELFANAAIEFLNKANKDNPFFAYVSFTAPHDPRTAPQKYHEQYPPSNQELPANYMDAHPFRMGDDRSRDERLAPFPRTPESIKKEQGDYYAMISATDTQIGRILKALEENGHAENTIIIFSSDNGLAVGQHGLVGKQNVYEHSIRLPLIIAGKNIPKNEKRDTFVYLHDLAPTILELAKAKDLGETHGKSFTKHITKKSNTEHRSHIYSAYDTYRWERARWEMIDGVKTRVFDPRGHSRSIRKGDYKLILSTFQGQDHTQLFNLAKDPNELENLANKKEHSELIDSLIALLLAEMKLADDKAKIGEPEWGFPEDRTY